MSSNLNLLKPKVKQLAEAFVKKCAEMQLPVEITATYRTFAEQDALYAQGRTKPGQVVTNARGGQSLHNYGCAFDFVPLNDVGQPDWNGDFYSRGKIGEALGLEWGGEWQGFTDMAHLQLTLGYSLKDFQTNAVNWARFDVSTQPAPSPVSTPNVSPAPLPASNPTIVEPSLDNLQRQVWIIQQLINLYTQLRAMLGNMGGKIGSVISQSTTMQNKKYGALSSSVDPNKLAASVEGVLKALGGLLAFWGLSQVAGDLNVFAQQIGTLITLGYSFYGVAEAAFGVARKIVVGIHAWYVSVRAQTQTN